MLTANRPVAIIEIITNTTQIYGIFVKISGLLSFLNKQFSSFGQLWHFFVIWHHLKQKKL